MGARPQKTAVVERVRDDLSATTATVLTDHRGLSVPQMAELREKLRESGATYKVAKNTLIRLAAKELGYDVPDATLSGPTALAYTGEDIASAAKALKNFAKDNPQLVIKGAILEGNWSPRRSCWPASSGCSRPCWPTCRGWSTTCSARRPDSWRPSRPRRTARAVRLFHFALPDPITPITPHIKE